VKQLFYSATLKLTLWYLLILMTISLLFSVIIYYVSTGELSNRFDNFESRLQIGDPAPNTPTPFESFRRRQLHDAEINLGIGIFYTNLSIIIFGGLGSYFLAKRTLRPIEEVHESMSRFTADASHELRTPLAVMKSELEVALRDSKLPKSEMREILSSNLEEVNRLSTMVQMLLQLSRLRYQDLEIKPVEVASLLTNAKVHSVPPKPGQKIEIINSVKNPIHTNAESLSELLIILLSNAVQYSPESATITLTAEKKSDSLLLTISNPGKGIPPDAIEHVFEPFYRADASRTKSGETTNFGLGLPLAKRIVEALGGSITIESETGVVTTVVCTLPQKHSSVQ